MSDLAYRDVTIRSTLDGQAEPCRVLASTAKGSQPLLVVLHTWSADWQQDLGAYMRQGQARGWHCLQPNFRGPNRRPQACASELAIGDILDAVQWAIRSLAVDEDRIYVAGGSGGGHMALMMACRGRDLFAGVSAWCPISDLSAWHRHHVGPPLGQYARDIEQSCGGAPGTSPAVDEQYRLRSPLFSLQQITPAPLDISHGIDDGKTGSVPFHHSIWAFNAIAQRLGAAAVSDDEAQQLWLQRRLSKPGADDERDDPSYGRSIMLRRQAGPHRLTIFDGGHDVLPAAACHWLSACSRSRGRVERDLTPLSLPDSGDGAVQIGR